MGQRQLVQAGGVEFLVELSEDDGTPIGTSRGTGIATVRTPKLPSFDDVSEVVGAIAGSLKNALESAKPTEAQLEFGLEVIGKTGKLTSVLVEGGGTATLKVTLTWK